jgi:hypothetical protein
LFFHVASNNKRPISCTQAVDSHGQTQVIEIWQLPLPYTDH